MGRTLDTLGWRRPTAAAFIDAEFARARTLFETGRASAPEAAVAEATGLYREVVERLSP